MAYGDFVRDFGGNSLRGVTEARLDPGREYNFQVAQRYNAEIAKAIQGTVAQMMGMQNPYASGLQYAYSDVPGLMGKMNADAAALYNQNLAPTLANWRNTMGAGVQAGLAAGSGAMRNSPYMSAARNARVESALIPAELQARNSILGGVMNAGASGMTANNNIYANYINAQNMAANQLLAYGAQAQAQNFRPDWGGADMMTRMAMSQYAQPQPQGFANGGGAYAGSGAGASLTGFGSGKFGDTPPALMGNSWNFPTIAGYQNGQPIYYGSNVAQPNNDDKKEK